MWKCALPQSTGTSFKDLSEYIFLTGNWSTVKVAPYCLSLHCQTFCASALQNVLLECAQCCWFGSEDIFKVRDL